MLIGHKHSIRLFVALLTLGTAVQLDEARAQPQRRGLPAPEESVSSVFPRGEVQIPISFLLDDELRVVDVFSGWSAASRRAIHGLIEEPREGG